MEKAESISAARALYQARDIHSMDDEYAGKFLLALYVMAQAEERGIDPSKVPPQLAESWIQQMQRVETNFIDDAGLESAIHESAAGNFAKGGARFKAWERFSIEVAAAFDEALTGRRKQSLRAQKPRPKSRATHKNVVVLAMRQYRAGGHTLDEFLDACAAGSIEGVRMMRRPAPGIERWDVEIDALDDPKGAARSTMEGWWRAAKQP